WDRASPVRRVTSGRARSGTTPGRSREAPRPRALPSGRAPSACTGALRRRGDSLFQLIHDMTVGVEIIAGAIRIAFAKLMRAAQRRGALRAVRLVDDIRAARVVDPSAANELGAFLGASCLALHRVAARAEDPG